MSSSTLFIRSPGSVLRRSWRRMLIVKTGSRSASRFRRNSSSIRARSTGPNLVSARRARYSYRQQIQIEIRLEDEHGFLEVLVLPEALEVVGLEDLGQHGPRHDLGGAERRAVRVLALFGAVEKEPKLNGPEALGGRGQEQQEDAHEIQRDDARDRCGDHAAVAPERLEVRLQRNPIVCSSLARRRRGVVMCPRPSVPPLIAVPRPAQAAPTISYTVLTAAGWSARMGSEQSRMRPAEAVRSVEWTTRVA